MGASPNRRFYGNQQKEPQHIAIQNGICLPSLADLILDCLDRSVYSTSQTSDSAVLQGSVLLVRPGEIPDIAGKKITTVKELSAEAIAKKANYTGKEVETDETIITTTGFDRTVVRAFLKAIYLAAEKSE